MELNEIQSITNKVIEVKYFDLIKKHLKSISNIAALGECTMALDFTIENSQIAMYLKRKGFDVDYIDLKIIIRW